MKKIILLLSLVGSLNSFSQELSGEYFFNEDPGFGNGFSFVITSEQATFTPDQGSIQTGFNRLFIRVKETDGHWSITQSVPYYQYTIPSNINYAEIFLDEDPGFGHGVEIPVTEGEGVEATLNLAEAFSLEAGEHIFYVRVRDVGGIWSLTSVDTVNIIYNEVPTIADQHFEIDENSPNETVVGEVVAADADQDQLAYSILSGNLDNAFSIDANTGVLIVNTSTALDFETTPTFNLIVQVDDGKGGLASGNVTISLNDIDETIAQTISFETIPDKTEGDPAFLISATASSGLSVVFKVKDGPATIKGIQVTLKGAGEVIISATQAGDQSYKPADPVDQTFCVNPKKPIITEDGELFFSSSDQGNQWFLNGESIPNEKNVSYSRPESGDVTLQVTIDGCQSEISDPVTATAQPVLGASRETEQGLNIYPNPVRNKLIIEFSRKSTKNCSVFLLDLSGKLLMTKDQEEIGNQRKYELDLSKLSNGIYTVILSFGNDLNSYIICKE